VELIALVNLENTIGCLSRSLLRNCVDIAVALVELITLVNLENTIGGLSGSLLRNSVDIAVTFEVSRDRIKRPQITSGMLTKPLTWSKIQIDDNNVP
jgi:hypothetical protein